MFMNILLCWAPRTTYPCYTRSFTVCDAVMFRFPNWRTSSASASASSRCRWGEGHLTLLSGAGNVTDFCRKTCSNFEWMEQWGTSTIRQVMLESDVGKPFDGQTMKRGTYTWNIYTQNSHHIILKYRLGIIIECAWDSFANAHHGVANPHHPSLAHSPS